MTLLSNAPICKCIYNLCIDYNVPEEGEIDFGFIYNDRNIHIPDGRINPDLVVRRRVHQRIILNHFNEI